MNPKLPTPPAAVPLALLLAALGPACLAGGDGPSPVPALVEGGRYEEAVVAAAERHEARPDDPERERELRLATVAVHLDRAREATLDGRDEDALEHIAKAERADPNNPVVADWRLKTNRKLSQHWLDTAHELESSGDFAGALEAFGRAREYIPSSAAAQQGQQRMLLLINYREGLGEAYYREGVRSLREYWLHRARAQLDYATEKYIPDDEKARERGEEVDELLAEERVARGRSLEEEGLYFAAGNEFRLALLLDPDNEAAQEGRTRMEREMGAKEKLDHAEWLRLRGRYGEARESLSEGREMTEDQVDEFASAEIDIDQAEYELLYEEALRLEHDYRFEEAVAAYEELLDVAGYYEDAITRKSTLEELIAQAEDLYGRAMATEDPSERLELLEELAVFWPEYRDVEERLETLRE